MDKETVGQDLSLSNLSIPGNQHCFVNHIPAEILESIFIGCARDYYNAARGHPIPTAPDWVNVSYVSRHWRTVALNCPTLWTYLFITSPRWTQELLARSKQASLKVHLTPDRRDKIYPELCFVEQVMNHVERIQELRLHFPFACCVIGLQWFSVLSSRPAPRLRTLQITADGSPPNWSSLLFDGDTPALRTLDLMDCPVPWYSFKLSGLTTLSLCYVPVRLQQNISEFLITLNGMQDLTHLYLEDALTSAVGFLSSEAFHCFDQIKLPYLSRLLLAAPLSTVIALLSCVKIPLKTELRLDCGAERHPCSLDDYSTLSSLLAQRFTAPQNQVCSTPTIRSLTIASAGRKATLSFSGSEHDCGSAVVVSCTEWDCNIPLQVTLHFGPSITADDVDDILSHVCCSIPFPNVRRLHVPKPPVSSTFWMHILGHLRDLRSIKLSHGLMPDLASLLSFAPCDRTENDTENGDGHADRGFVPALEELELHQIDLSVALERDVVPFKAVSVRSLCDALATRRDSRGQLIMTQCTEGDSNFHENAFDMMGRWEGGHFHVYSKRLFELA